MNQNQNQSQNQNESENRSENQNPSRVLVLHGYSARNAGDGLLVEQTLELIRDALGEDAEITLVASHHETFGHLGLPLIDSMPGRRGFAAPYLQALLRPGDFDVRVGVGGGYLRARTPVETLKGLIIQGPQLLSAAGNGRNTVYLPQSVGPLPPVLRQLAARALTRMHAAYLRDDRSMGEYQGEGILRAPDLAVLGQPARASGAPEVGGRPVLSVRHLRGRLPGPVKALAHRLGEFDGYIQSVQGTNDDTAAVRSTRPRRILARDELLTPGTPRIVVAMRLHAALMALHAGHYVIHLAYERKGFGAFGDLGLDGYVHGSRGFDPGQVIEQMRVLRDSAPARAEYDAAIDSAMSAHEGIRERIVESIRAAARNSAPAENMNRAAR